MSGTLGENTPDEALLDMLDQTLRNGSNPTRANLVFDVLCERLGFDRHQLPGYKADMKKLEEEDRELAGRDTDFCACKHYRKTHPIRRCAAIGCTCLEFNFTRRSTSV